MRPRHRVHSVRPLPPQVPQSSPLDSFPEAPQVSQGSLPRPPHEGQLMVPLPPQVEQVVISFLLSAPRAVRVWWVGAR